MKRLTSVQIDGLKKAERIDLPVPGLLALAGPNGAGKSTILQAIRIAVLGYEPSVGKTPAATRQLAPSGEMEIGLAFDDGFGVKRRVGRSNVTEVTPPRGEKLEAERQARIVAETGAFVPSFNLADFLALSAEKRREQLFRMLPRETGALTEEVYRHWLGYDDADELVQRAVDKLWVEKVLEAESPVDGLATAVEHVRMRFNEAEKARLDQVAIHQRAAASAADATTASEAEIAAGDDPAALQVELAAATERLGQLQARASDAEAAARRARERDEQLQSASAKLVQARRREEELRTELDTLAGGVDGGPSDAEVSAASAESARRRADLAAAREAAAELGPRVRQAEDLVRQRKDRLARLDGTEACPVCGTEGADLERVREQMEQVIADAEREREALAAEASTVARDVKGAAGALEAAEAAERGILDRVRAARSVASRRSQIEAELAALGAKVEGLEQLQARLAAEEVSESEPAAPEALRATATVVADLRSRIAAEQARRSAVDRAAGKAEAERERADQEAKELARLAGRAEALKRVLGALQKLRGHVIRQMIAPVEATAAGILADIDPGKRFEIIFEREGKDTFDFGFEADGEFRGFLAASKGEAAVLAIVFVAGLVAAVQPAWPVLMVDDIDAVDDYEGVHSRQALMASLAKIADRFGNIIVAGCVNFGSPEGWTVVDPRTLGGALPVPPSARKRASRARGGGEVANA